MEQDFLRRLLCKIEEGEDLEVLSESRAEFLLQEIRKERRLRAKIDMDDYHTLDSGEWLADTIINTYLAVLKLENDEIGATNTFFFKKLERDGPASASKWEGIDVEPLDSYRSFLVPVCVGVHWILQWIDFEEQVIYNLDSLGSQNYHISSTLNNFLVFMGVGPLRIVSLKVPGQMNGYDCGVFVCKYAQCIFNGMDLNSFTQTDIHAFRRELKHILAPFVV